jgi:hypothetical protein
MNQTNATRRTFQKVRRDSRPVGSCEADLWKPTDAQQMRVALKAAERFDLAHKNKGRRSGPLGYTGLLVFRALWRFVRFRDGCLCPSYERLMRATRLSKGAVAGALKRLRACGFLTWRRRLEYTGEAGVRGREVRQATNAYALAVPAAALAHIGSIPLPGDALDRIKARAAFVAACEREAFDNSPLGRTLSALGAAIVGRPSLPNARNPSQGSILLVSKPAATPRGPAMPA